MWFSAQIIDRDLWTVIKLEGELDMASKAIVVGVIDGALNAGSGRLMLDFTDLAFIDTAGLSGILRMLDKADRLGGDLVIANPSALAAEVLDVAGFRDVVHAPVALAADRHRPPGGYCRAWGTAP